MPCNLWLCPNSQGPQARATPEPAHGLTFFFPVCPLTHALKHWLLMALVILLCSPQHSCSDPQVYSTKQLTLCPRPGSSKGSPNRSDSTLNSDLYTRLRSFSLTVTGGPCIDQEGPPSSSNSTRVGSPLTILFSALGFLSLAELLAPRLTEPSLNHPPILAVLLASFYAIGRSASQLQPLVPLSSAWRPFFFMQPRASRL
ncbi:hypothetical protein GOP47_0025846 [Adiantum capillus-veneris]|uniref:Uncharacterized protein n=1 Tax=Adiantum capillus-veneris TaxID=13818 RepID=A0A9D4Z3X4_ADICA|nr:hypothetical protein GOP47_0025846 [Adiantum capillus-veneris]